MSAGVTGFAFSVFLPAMTEDLGWYRSTLVGATSLGWVVASLAGPVVGRIIDRRGARLMLALSVLGMAASAALSALTRDPWHFYLAFGLLGGVCRAVLQNVAPGAMVANWFVRRRSLAFGVAALGPPASSLVYPPLAAAVVASAGWRTGWLALAAFTLAAGFLPTRLVRRRPEDMGLAPDGDPPAERPVTAPVPGTPAAPDGDWSFSEALRSPAFWLLATAMSCILLAPSAVVLFLFSFFRDQGMAEGVAAATISVLSLCQAGSRVLFWIPFIAWSGSVRWPLIAWGLLLLLAVLFLTTAHSVVLAFLASGFMGLAMGGNLVLQLQIWPEYYGRTAVGGITGAAQLVQSLAAGGGPLLGAALVDATGSYTGMFYAVAVAVVTGVFIHLLVGKPRRAVTRAIA